MSAALFELRPGEPPIERDASISPCERYRYRLSRRWASGPLLPFIMLNPSTADDKIDDPTIRRCMGFARRGNYGGIVVANLHAFRATRPEELKHTVDPFGPDNDAALYAVAIEASAFETPIICAWGVSGGMFAGDKRALGILRAEGRPRRLVCLGKTANGMPRHPLYVRADQPFEPFREPHDPLPLRS